MSNKQEIKELQKKIDKLQSKLKVLEAEPAEWQPRAGELMLDQHGVIHSITPFNIEDYNQAKYNGSLFETYQSAKSAKFAYQAYHRLYKLAEELNGDWKPDWTDWTQRKYCLKQDWIDENWGYDYDLTDKNPTTVYFSEDAINQALEIVKRGAV